MNIDYQLAPPHMHRRNAAKRAIRTWKAHFIAGLCSTDKMFPMHLWDRLIEQAEIMLNLLRPSRTNPKLSAYAAVNGPFDFNRMPLAPPGTKVVVHKKPNQRKSWDPHGISGWYIGPAVDHYHCYKVYIPKTQSEQIADTVEFFPQYCTLPTLASKDMAVKAAIELADEHIISYICGTTL